jgi:polysaccharide export outer membrane protein
MRVLVCGSILAFSLIACRTPIPATPLESVSNDREFLSDGEYRLGAGDEVRVRSLGDATFDGTYQVSDSGRISLPLVGDVIAAGEALATLETKIASTLVRFVKDPNINVTLVARRSNRVYFSGEFVRVGLVQIDVPTNLAAAVSLAGGLTPFASGRLVLVRTDVNNPSGPSVRYALDYRDLQKGHKNFDAILVRRGDLIIAE